MVNDLKVSTVFGRPGLAGRIASRSVALMLLFSCTAPFGRFGEVSAQEPNRQAELQSDLNQLEAFLASRNLDALRSRVDSQALKWQARDHSSYVTYMRKACSIVSSYAWRDESRQALLLSHYAMSVLANSTELPLEEHTRFVEFLSLDPIIVDEVTWRNLRLQKAQLFLQARRRLASSVIPNFDFNDRPTANVPTPPGSNMPSGVSPEAIKNQKLRAEYETAIARNADKANRYNEQYWLKQNAPRFYHETEMYLVDAYSRPPDDSLQLQRLLSEYGDEGVRTRVLDEIHKARR